MLSRIHVYAASLGLLLAGSPVAVGQSAVELPTFEVMGFPITRHQVAVLGSAQVRERAPTPTLTDARLSPSGGCLNAAPENN